MPSSQRDAEAQRDTLTERIIAAAIEVHRALGPGLLESAYEECLCHEFKLSGLRFERQVALPVNYKSVRLDCAYRMDIVVEGRVVLEIKAVEALLAVHSAQLLTYLKLAALPTGLLLNFSAPVMKEGIKRLSLTK